MSYPEAALSRRTLLKAGGTGLAMAGLASLAACTSAGSGSGSKTLTVAYFGDQKAADAFRKRIEPVVRKLDKSVTVRVNGTSGTDWNVFFAKLLTQIASGSSPDIVSVATEGLQLMASKDLAMPLDDYVKRDIKELKSYFDDVPASLVEAMMFQGHLYELPTDYNAGNMYYNTALLQQAGVAAPTEHWTIDDFHAASTALARNKNTEAYGWVVRLWGSWTSFLYANGGNLLEEGKYPGGSWLWDAAYKGDPSAQGRSGGWKWGDPTANSAEAVEALQYLLEMKRAGLSPSPDVSGGSDLQNLFAAGRVGMAIGGGFWAGGLANAGMKRGSFDVQFFPEWKSQRHLFGASGFAIFQKSDKKDLAWEVVKELSKPSSFDVIFPGNATTPARQSLLTAERYATTGPQNWQVFGKTLTEFPTTAPIPAPPYYNALATALNQRTTQAISSGDVKSALDGLQRDLEAARSSAGS